MSDNKSNVAITLEHISSSTNKSPRCVSSEKHGLYLFGTSNCISVCQTHYMEDGTAYQKVIDVLSQHKDRVNCVRWIRDAGSSQGEKNPKDGPGYFVSGSADSTVVCWKVSIGKSGFIYDKKQVLTGHSGSITCIDGIIFLNHDNEKQILIASSGADSSLILWSGTLQALGNITMLQKIELGTGLVLSLSLELLSASLPILACGSHTGAVFLYCSNSDSKCFELALTLHGHEDWVRDSDFLTLENNDLLLATCSQDSFIRLWRISSEQNEAQSIETEFGLLSLKKNKFQVSGGSKEYTVLLESVLSGHEGWVYSVHWMPQSRLSPKLLSASMDKSVIIWEWDSESELWLEKVRFGEVGGNTLGFYGARFNSDGTEVMAHSYNGALHVWKHNTGKEEGWKSGVTVSGHFSAVQDLDWEPVHGRFLLTTSSDQTTRLIAPWTSGGAEKECWHEIARPQIHGYDMQCLALISSYCFVSGADEKVLRVFEAPRNFIKNFYSISNVDLSKKTEAPEGASVPALGLSNKAVFDEISQVKEEGNMKGVQYIENQFTSVVLSQPPTEEHLLQNTLWPETHKLYSHVYEIFCVASSSCGSLVASAAKSATPEHSCIVLWDTNTWKEVTKLSGHSLTVTQMEFSNDSRFLLSVSRDRTWILHQISKTNSDVSVQLYAKSEKKTGHSRIIWSCTWTCDDKYFSTSSRDKKIMFWEHNDERKTVDRVCVLDASESVTAVAFSQNFVHSQGKYLLCIGKEGGAMELYLFSCVNREFNCSLLQKFGDRLSHTFAVKRLKWRPLAKEKDTYWLASCSHDHVVKIFTIKFEFPTEL